MLTCSCVIDSRGRLTVPREVRHKLGLSAGDRVVFVVEDEQVVLRFLRSAVPVTKGRRTSASHISPRKK